MSITLTSFAPEEIDISMSEAMRYMGVTGAAPEIAAIAEKLLPELRKAASPKACFEEYPVIRDDGGIRIGTVSSDSTALMKCLDGCDSAVIFAATVGAGVDRLIARYLKLEPSKAVILSGLGGAMIESLCDRLCLALSEEYGKKGKCIKPRFSPGYGGFALSAQREISRLLDTERRIGLYHTESLMMIPEKSVTAVVGIYEKQRME